MKKLTAILMMILMVFSVSANAARIETEIPADVKIVDIYSDNLNDFFDDLVMGDKYQEEVDFYALEYYPLNITVNAPQIEKLENLAYGQKKLSGIMSSTGYFELFSIIDSPSNVGALYDQEQNTLYYFPDCVITSFKPTGEVKLKILELNRVENQGGEWARIYDITPATAKLKRFACITVKYNDEIIAFDQKPVIEDGRTLVPLRAIFEKLGAEIDWNGETKTVTATKGDTVITLTIDSTNATKNGEAIALDVPAKIISDRTMVPVRFIADSFGVKVDWNADLRQVVLTN